MSGVILVLIPKHIILMKHTHGHYFKETIAKQISDPPPSLLDIHLNKTNLLCGIGFQDFEHSIAQTN
jgi:hypothetical protein